MQRVLAVASHVQADPAAASSAASVAATAEVGVAPVPPPLTAITPKAPGHEGLGPLASRYVDVGEMPWVTNNVTGVLSKQLLLDPRTGMATGLSRTPPNVFVQSSQGVTDHEHVQVEQTFVLEGSLIDDEGECTAGNFVWRPPGCRHSAHSGPEGCMTIGIFVKPNRFFGKDGSETDLMGRDYKEVAATLIGGEGIKRPLTAVTPNAPQHAKLSEKASRYVNTAELPWGKTRFPGVEFKTLMTDPENGMSTSLVRFAPGATLPDHEHAHIEQTYVLKGSLLDEEGACTAGNFVWRPPGSRHSAHAGPEGCVTIAIFMRPNRFFEKDGSETDMMGRDYGSNWKGKD